MDTQRWLEQYLQAQGGVAGTVHRHLDGLLLMEAAVNIPEPVRRATERIPRGKGMAGLALERDQPVSTCNLQTPSPDVKPGAAAVGAGAAVAFPVHDGAGAVRAVVGIAFAEARDLAPAAMQALADAAADLLYVSLP
jgi:hypothetical protein